MCSSFSSARIGAFHAPAQSESELDESLSELSLSSLSSSSESLSESLESELEEDEEEDSSLRRQKTTRLEAIASRLEAITSFPEATSSYLLLVVEKVRLTARLFLKGDLGLEAQKSASRQNIVSTL